MRQALPAGIRGRAFGWARRAAGCGLEAFPLYPLGHRRQSPVAQRCRLEESGKRGPDRAALLQGTFPTHDFLWESKSGSWGEVGAERQQAWASDISRPECSARTWVISNPEVSCPERGRPFSAACARSWRGTGLNNAPKGVKKDAPWKPRPPSLE